MVPSGESCISVLNGDKRGWGCYVKNSCEHPVVVRLGAGAELYKKYNKKDEPDKPKPYSCMHINDHVAAVGSQYLVAAKSAGGDSYSEAKPFDEQ